MVSVRQKPFPKDSPMCHFAKNHSPKIRHRVSGRKTIPQRCAKDSPTCQFAKNHFPKIRQRFAIVSVHKPFAKDWTEIRQRAGSPKTIRQRFANVSVPQKPFPKDSPKIRQRVSSPKTIPQRFAKDSPMCQFAKNHSSKIRQRFANV